MRFKSKPRPLGEGGLAAVDAAAVADFVGAAVETPVEQKPVVAAAEAARGSDKPTCGINLRLTERELDMIRRVAALDDRSIQKTIRRLLLPAVETALRRTAERCSDGPTERP